MNNVEIVLSADAYNEFKSLLKSYENDYSCIRLSYINSCCKRSNVDIYLDDLNNKEEYSTKDINGIHFIYDQRTSDNIKKIEFLYNNSSFMIKSTPRINSPKNCSKCSKCNKCT